MMIHLPRVNYHIRPPEQSSTGRQTSNRKIKDVDLVLPHAMHENGLFELNFVTNGLKCCDKTASRQKSINCFPFQFICNLFSLLLHEKWNRKRAELKSGWRETNVVQISDEFSMRRFLVFRTLGEIVRECLTMKSLLTVCMAE